MARFEGAAPPPEGVTPNFDHPKDVLKTINIVSGILAIGLTAPFVLLRFYVRVFIMRAIDREDCTYSLFQVSPFWIWLIASRVLPYCMGMLNLSSVGHYDSRIQLLATGYCTTGLFSLSILSPNRLAWSDEKQWVPMGVEITNGK